MGRQNPDNVRLRANSDKNVPPIGEWLQKELGGKVFINPEAVSSQFRTADFMHRNQKWELKSKGEGAIGDYVVFSSIKSGKGQANNFIIDFTDSPLEYEDIFRQVDYAFNKKHISWFRKLIVT